MTKQLVDLELEIRHETEKAFLVSDGKTTCWLPKSMVEYDEEGGVFTLPVWLATEKELI